MSIEWRAKHRLGVGPVNGGSPTSISYTTHARLYWSLRPSISAAARRLLRAHIGGRPDDRPGLREVLASPARAHGPRDAEVRHDGRAAREHDVLRFDVAVHDAVDCGVRQRARHFVAIRSASVL